MVIGNGLVAKGFSRYNTDDRFLIFASGVSDSTAVDKAPFEREHNLLSDSISRFPDKKIVYISTCSICDPSMQQSPYVQHKLLMEQMLKEKAPNYIIFRVPNLAGFTDNPHTVLNYFYQHITNGTPFQLWEHARRNIIDIADTFAIADSLLQSGTFTNKIINIANPHSYTVVEIVEEIENITGLKADYTLVKKGSSPVIDISDIQKTIKQLNLNFDEGYLNRMIKKYLARHDL